MANQPPHNESYFDGGSPASPQSGISPHSPPSNASAYQQLNSALTPTEPRFHPTIAEEEDIGDRGAHSQRGLGFTNAPLSPGAQSTPTSPNDPDQPGHARSFSQSTAYDPPMSNRYASRKSPGSFQSGFERPYGTGSRDHLTANTGAPSMRSTTSKRSKYDNEFTPEACPATRTFYQGGSHWLTITIYILVIFSTVFSGIYLGIAIAAPRWGTHIHSGGSLTASTANVLTQLFAKLIELSFVCCFVTFLGQVLSRRAFSRASRGVSLAEMSMRNWIMQPGTLLTHYETVYYIGLTFLGAVSLTVAILAALYSTAASALITPVLKFGSWEARELQGLVKTTFANPIYLSETCQTPIISNTWDTDYTQDKVGQTCLTIDHAAQGFHNYQQFMTRWATIVGEGNGTDLQADRPEGFGLFLQNTTVNGTWIEKIDTKAVSQQYNRIVNNVTMAMPHTGVFQAARDPKSNIMQPEDLDGLGAYNIRAALPSPYLNVLCANVKKDEIASLVYETAVKNVTLNATADLNQNNLTTYYPYKFNWSTWDTLTTPVDDLFGWGANGGQPHPVFYKFPTNWNTLLNNTAPWGQDSLYMLGQGGIDMESTTRGEYLLCRVKAGLTPKCATEYQAQDVSGTMRAHCEDPNDEMAYNRANSSRATTVSLDWINVAETTLNALSLNNGVIDGQASNARLLMQLMLQNMELNPALPSPAEALAVMTSCSLLMSSQDSPFVEFWNYTNTELKPGVYQYFNATVRAQQYASGGTQPYQRAFIVVLFAVFAINLFVLIYLLVNRGLVTDYSEPPNLFALAINSPPSVQLKGSCGAGPEGKQYTIKWGVEMEDEHVYITDKQNSIYPSGAPGALKESRLAFSEMFGRNKGTWKSVPEETEMEMGTGTGYSPNVSEGRVGESPRVEIQGVEEFGPPQSRDSNISRMFSKIAKRKSVL
ncbi:hypothetical protein BT63DRAFT_426063 [Microthyrium microscopicum]|uniref:Uncharacterized protein n=1 Tax=Microthyrium microscopicum TaxID=703497 RepID=A0A6A6UCG1_9PEZI|nr:hypothetical protein BT63DRAFT_426063 [Microthyrium microscopicum]